MYVIITTFNSDNVFIIREKTLKKIIKTAVRYKIPLKDVKEEFKAWKDKHDYMYEIQATPLNDEDIKKSKILIEKYKKELFNA